MCGRVWVHDTSVLMYISCIHTGVYVCMCGVYTDYELPQHCLLGVSTGSSSTTSTFLRVEFCRFSTVEFCNSCSAACSIIFCVKVKNMSSIPWFCLADVWQCVAPTWLAYLQCITWKFVCNTLYDKVQLKSTNKTEQYRNKTTWNATR